MTDRTTPSPDPALDTLEAVAGHLATVFESGDPDAMARALALVSRSDGLVHLAAAAGLPRAELAAALGAGEVGLDTLLSIMKVIDLHRPEGSAPD